MENQEKEAGIACIAAPVLGNDGFAVAPIGVTGLEPQLMRERRPMIIQGVVHAASALARRTGLRGA